LKNYCFKIENLETEEENELSSSDEELPDLPLILTDGELSARKYCN